MQEFDKQLLDTIEEIANHFAIETVQTLISNLRKKKLVTSRDLINSLTVESRSDLAKIAHSMAFAFEEYGRYHDMKSNRWTAMPPIDKIKEWVLDKGLNAFGADPNPYKKKQKSKERRLNEIAWGVARNKLLKKNSFKKRLWFQSPFYKALAQLELELSLGIMDRSLEEMKAALLYRLKEKGAGL